MQSKSGPANAVLRLQALYVLLPLRNWFDLMDDFLTLAARTHPDRLALLDGDQNLTYAELNTAVGELAARLTAHGIQQRQRVAVLLGRSRDAVQLVHALVRIGASLVPLNTRLTAAEMQYQIDEADCRWLVSPQNASLPQSTQRDTKTLKTSCPFVLFVVKKEGYGDPICLDGLPETALDPRLVGALELDAEFGILFTSGTTGKPKGARLLWKNIYASAKASAERLGTHPNDRWLLTLPLYHIGGLSILLRSALYGTAVILPNFKDDQFDLVQLQKRMHEAETTMVSLVPTMLHRLLEQSNSFPESLRLILLGGAAVSSKLLEQAFAQNLPVATTYGLTECASQVATATPDETRRKPTSVGKPLPGIHVEIRDDEGHLLPSGEIGNIHVAGDVVMFGYIGQAEIEEWLRTGDLGYLDEDGDLFIVQRRSDLIVSGGENVYPAEVEAVLTQHPDVVSACVVGIPDEQWGQRVAAALILEDEADFKENEFLTFCRQYMAGYKIPRKINVLSAFPKTASGKVQRKEILHSFLEKFDE